MQNAIKNVKALGSPLLDEAHGITYAFCTRHGGVSGGLYYSLNCGFGSSDDPANVRYNRALALAQLGSSRAKLVTCRQAHTANVEFVTRPWTNAHTPVADSMVTNCPNLALAVLTADCAPVLLADPVSKIIGAVHAGWRGAIAGVIDKTLTLMSEKGADISSIIAAIGPCIRQASYEVDTEFKNRFVKNNSINERFFFGGKGIGRHHFDLSAYVRYQLERGGVEHISQLDGDTFADDDKFFSYRRSVLNGEDNYGRGISMIALGQLDDP